MQLPMRYKAVFSATITGVTISDNTIDNNLSDNTIDNNLSDNTIDNNLSDNTIDNNLSDNTIDNNLSDNTIDNNLSDSVENISSSGVSDPYSDNQAPTVTLISPEDRLVNTGAPLNFSFTADNALNAQCKDQNLTYEVDIDGEPIEGLDFGTMRPGECIQTQDITNLSEGAHDWSVYIEDEAGNNVTSDSRTFYVDKNGLRGCLKIQINS